MSPVSGATIRSVIRNSGKTGVGAGREVVVVDEVVVDKGTMVVVVDVGGADVVVDAAGSFDEVHEAAISAAATNTRIFGLMDPILSDLIGAVSHDPIVELDVFHPTRAVDDPESSSHLFETLRRRGDCEFQFCEFESRTPGGDTDGEVDPGLPRRFVPVAISVGRGPEPLQFPRDPDGPSDGSSGIPVHDAAVECEIGHPLGICLVPPPIGIENHIPVQIVYGRGQ